MKIKQKGLLCITVVILLTLVCGITGCKQNKTAAEIEATVRQGTMDYLNEKYEDTFTITNYLQLAFPGGSGVDLKIQSEKYQEEFSAHVDYEDDGYVYTDTYFKLTMKEDAEKYFETLVKDFLGDNVIVKIQFKGSAPKGISGNSDFDECIKKNLLLVDIYIFGAEQVKDKEDQLEQLVEEIVLRKISPALSYTCVVPESKDIIAKQDLGTILENTSVFIEKQSYFIWKDFSVEKYELQKYKTKE